MNREVFKDKIKQIFPNTDEKFFQQIEKFKNFIQQKNKMFNLTRLDSDEHIYGEYFYESLRPYSTIKLNSKSVLDIGSGGGVPGVLLKLLNNSISLTIIEANSKKTNFLKELCSVLSIEVNILTKRAEDISSGEREKFDIVTSRAVAELKIILEVSVPYCKVGGIIIEPKGKNYMVELNNAKKIISLLNISLQKIVDTDFFFTKNDKTNPKFPRKWNVIIRN